jgi:hypothetical protein
MGFKGLAGSVGVVWQLHAKSIASIEVYWRTGERQRTSDTQEPANLELVSEAEAPEYAIQLKKSLGL